MAKMNAVHLAHVDLERVTVSRGQQYGYPIFSSSKSRYNSTFEVIIKCNIYNLIYQKLNNFSNFIPENVGKKIPSYRLILSLFNATLRFFVAPIGALREGMTVQAP